MHLRYHRDLHNSTRAVVTVTTVVESRDCDTWGVKLAGRTLRSGDPLRDSFPAWYTFGGWSKGTQRRTRGVRIR